MQKVYARQDTKIGDKHPIYNRPYDAWSGVSRDRMIVPAGWSGEEAESAQNLRMFQSLAPHGYHGSVAHVARPTELYYLQRGGSAGIHGGAFGDINVQGIANHLVKAGVGAMGKIGHDFLNVFKSDPKASLTLASHLLGRLFKGGAIDFKTHQRAVKRIRKITDKVHGAGFFDKLKEGLGIFTSGLTAPFRLASKIDPVFGFGVSQLADKLGVPTIGALGV